jgi:DNA replication protein DnaC
MSPAAEAVALEVLLRSLKLPGFVSNHAALAERAAAEGVAHGEYLRQLCEIELDERRVRRIERRLRQSRLPPDKTLATLQLARLPRKVAQQIPALCEGTFVRKAINVLAFGSPGTGKSHTVCAIGHELIQRDFEVYFTKTYHLVQRLLAAKRDYSLERELKRLDRFDVVILDDIGYIQQDRAEMEVLFAFLAERYERRSLLITSNLVFSQWDKIFQDAMTTAAAIDRLVHHCVILELTGPSFRTQQAHEQNKGGRRRKSGGDPSPGEKESRHG